MACTGLTDLELGLLSILVACDPLDPPQVYSEAMESLTLSSSSSILAILLSTQELFNLAPGAWANLRLRR